MKAIHEKNQKSNISCPSICKDLEFFGAVWKIANITCAPVCKENNTFEELVVTLP